MDVATATSLPGEHGDPTPDLPFKRLCLMEHNWVRRASQETCGQCSGPYKYDVWHILIQYAVWGGYPYLFIQWQAMEEGDKETGELSKNKRT